MFSAARATSTCTGELSRIIALRFKHQGWRAGCGESRTSGSEGGQRYPANAGSRALPYCDGKLMQRNTQNLYNSLRESHRVVSW